MAVVYWDLEWTLQQQGFDYTYDKRLYDRLRQGSARPEPVRELPTDQDWADVEFGEATLPDERLNKRLGSIARDFYARPTANIAQACGSRAKTKAVYRFCAHQDVSMEAILQPHYESSLGRAAQYPVVLAIQDTTFLNYTTHSACEDLGPIGSFGAQATLGLLVHSTLLLSPEGTPLGLLNAQCWARSLDQPYTPKQRERLPIDQKESRKWMVGYEATAQAQRRLPSTRFVCVADREADIFELFVRARQSKEQPTTHTDSSGLAIFSPVATAGARP